MMVLPVGAEQEDYAREVRMGGEDRAEHDQ